VPTCDECGCRQLEEAWVARVRVLRCPLCGHLHGDDGDVARAEEILEAEARGFLPIVYPLVKALESVPAFRVTQASAGSPARREYPFVFLRVKETGLRDVGHLLTSLEMANRQTRRRWVVECSLQRGLLFILRPRFWKPVLDITPADIEEARSDLPLLGQALRRDVGLAWWQGR